MSYTHACQFVYACTCSYSPWSTSSWSLWVWVWMGSDMGGNCPTWFPLYISFLHKSFHPAFSVLGNQERKSLTCLNMVHNCPKTGPDPNKQGAKLSQRGLDTKTETGAIRIDQMCAYDERLNTCSKGITVGCRKWMSRTGWFGANHSAGYTS